MPLQYTINLQNASKHRCEYTITHHPTAIAAGKTWSFGIYPVSVQPGETTEINIDIPSSPHAYMLATVRGPPKHESEVRTISKIPIKLGKKDLDGSGTPGTTVEVFVDKEPSLRVAEDMPNALENGFTISTRSNFSYKDSNVQGRENRLFGPDCYLIGFGSEDKLWSAIEPRRNQRYHVGFSAVFSLHVSNLIHSNRPPPWGTVVDAKALQGSIKVDFKKIDTNKVKIIHDQDKGELVIEGQNGEEQDEGDNEEED